MISSGPMPKANEISVIPGTWIFRNVPRHLMRRTKAAAAIVGKDSVKALVIELVASHLQDLERKGILPKEK